ncbi:putative mitochondrial DNA repair and recombination helicase protein PIF2 [Leptomonas pyrrhocoris]|uniref:ATP-dependent DNA helicase n=1 Tax=Leptomonas pyrrhocoris TaxID=157538 RepID=A0A0M9FVI3_LEPPY|nr:putative mitochondrial DNA repair and recombination helicase protein PIF2 [Leptomonas pyrrhocoris]KPA76935.1 putative mitochondrial DNA repair and recombination helicase protein PIF2 [Leptomonas pyrrhocoris]|eukprot:XP_015655374.1 putative mitochondrial DNA repair and recombination helicase protein PIF2 [Leptomonas pyrrhocoris]
MPTTAREAPSEDECPDEKAAPQPERVGRQHHTTAATITKARNDDDDSAEAPRTSAHDADTVCTREGDAAVATAATAVTSSAEMDGQDTHDERQADGLDEDDVVVDANMNCSGAPQPASSATSRHRRSHKLILDPVEWLAQAADAPLMDLEALYSSTAVTDTMAYASSVSYADEGAAAVAHEHNEDGISFSTGDVTPPTTDGTMTVDARPPPETAVVHRYLAPTREGEEQEAELLADLLRDVPPQRQKQRRRQQPGPAHNPSYTQAESTESANTTAAPLPASLQAATDKPALESDALVYNVFTRRIAKASSSTIRMLALMGIGVQPETRELTVTDPEALQSLASELRAHRVSWPKLWSRGPLYRQLESLLSDEHVADAAERVAGLLRLQYNKSHLQRQRPGLVVGDGSPTGGGISSLSSTSADAAPAMAESVDDKLLTVQDLNEEQQAVVELIMQGHHTYIGGGAGTGKSVLLRVIKQRLVQEGLAVAVTGTTGIAGTQIGGCTLHHCLGINVSGEFTRRKDLSSYDVIIIDEVSMLSLELFESLEVHLRRANNVHLPFGGVQMILCGDFLQLGAIDSRPLITSQLFRRYFVHLKLETVVRQNKDLRFAAQLQQLRRGRVPADLSETVRFVSPQQIQAAQQAEVELKRRQHAQLARLAPQGENGGEGRTTNGTDTTSGDGGQDERQSGDGISGGNTNCVSESTTANGGTRAAAAPMVPFVNGAVNLLPTNREVNLTNAQQLQQLPGEPVTYAPQFLPPCLVGCWSPTFILRVCEPEKLHMKTLRLEIQRYLGNFYTMGQRASPASQPPVTASAVGFSDGEWLLNPHLGERSVVLYPLFVDALVFRVRLPLTMDREEVRQFLMHVAELDRHLATLQVGVRIRDVLAHGEGMHTEQDEYILSQYAARAPLAHSLTLKVGARVMLRTNFAPGLVNGSLGTVVGFRKLVLEELPRYLVGNAQREESIVQYSDFLQYEQGFQAPIVPVVDFNGRQVPIPPMTQYVGGMPNTHHYSMGIVALPLSLAYAFTVHKVQGLTLVGRVHLELSRMWPCEHLLYVAMSRVRNPEQLSVSSFHQHLVRAAADCLLFDDSLPPVWSATIAPYMLAATWKRSPSRRKKVLLKKQLEAYVKQRRSKLMDDARKGDIRAEIRLLEEKMLQQRARAAARAKERTLKKNGS